MLLSKFVACALLLYLTRSHRRTYRLRAAHALSGQWDKTASKTVMKGGCASGTGPRRSIMYAKQAVACEGSGLQELEQQGTGQETGSETWHGNHKPESRKAHTFSLECNSRDFLLARTWMWLDTCGVGEGREDKGTACNHGDEKPPCNWAEPDVPWWQLGFLELSFLLRPVCD